jgi:hypothetical protein
LQWRKEFEVDKIVRSLENEDEDDGGNDGESIVTSTDLATILRKENETGKIYVRGYDKDGRVSSDDTFYGLNGFLLRNQ